MNLDAFDLIREWERDGFKLLLYDTNQTDRYGKSVLAYRLFGNGSLIFAGADFHASPMHAIDSEATLCGLLAFLSLRPGDTDADYFASYTPDQLVWAKSSRAEELACIVSDLEDAMRGLTL